MKGVLLYYGSFLCLLPGGLLALFYASVARLASSDGWGDLLGLFVAAVEWLVGWRLALLLAVLVLLAVAGAIPLVRPWVSGALALASAASLVTILWLPSGGPGLAEVPFAATLIVAGFGFAAIARTAGSAPSAPPVAPTSGLR